MTERHGRVHTVCTLSSMCAVGLIASGVASVGAAAGRDTVHLVPAPTALVRGCTDAARHLEVAVQCPTRVPRGWRPRVCAGCNGTFSATGWFPAPRAYVGQPGEATGHFTVWAAPPRRIQQGYVGCVRGRALQRTRVRGVTMTFVTCPPGSSLDSGHVLLRWSREGWLRALSLHGNTRLNRLLLLRMAATLTTHSP